MSQRYEDLVARVRESVWEGPGGGPAGRRSSVGSRAAVLGRRRAPDENLPEELRAYVDRVTRRAFDVTYDDVDALRRAGYPENAIFEITASAAVGAGMFRLERGLAALRGES